MTLLVALDEEHWHEPGDKCPAYLGIDGEGHPLYGFGEYEIGKNQSSWQFFTDHCPLDDLQDCADFMRHGHLHSVDPRVVDVERSSTTAVVLVLTASEWFEEQRWQRKLSPSKSRPLALPR